MNQTMRNDARRIINLAISAVLPDQAVRRALQDKVFCGKIVLVSVGKAAWQMAKAACDCLGEYIENGIVITKYGHAKSDLPNIVCYEAGHPVPDENSFIATQAAIDLVSNLAAEDTVVFLLSGGGSALFEKALIPCEELQDITNQMLAGGADIVEMNTIRKRLSGVKGGRFAQLCAPASVFSIVLSDILGDPLDMIASGPACADQSTCKQALAVAKKYNLKSTEHTQYLLRQETPKIITNVETMITGSVRELCAAAADDLRCPGRLSPCMIRFFTSVFAGLHGAFFSEGVVSAVSALSASQGATGGYVGV